MSEKMKGTKEIRDEHSSSVVMVCTEILRDDEIRTDDMRANRGVGHLLIFFWITDSQCFSKIKVVIILAT